jgi:uncharacterized protein
MKYKLTMVGSNDVEQILLYDPMTSEILWEESQERPALTHLGDGVEYSIESKVWTPFAVTDPSDPALHGRKSATPMTLKITMGLKCNYKCTYCNQAHQPHDSVGGPQDAEELVQKIKNNFKIGTFDKPRIEFWGGEPLVYWKTIVPLTEKVRKLYPNAQFMMVTNGSLLDRDKIDWFNKMGFSIGMSHDGPLHAQNRGPDPLDEYQARDAVCYALKTMGQMRFSFNCVLTRENVSLKAVRNFILTKLNTEDTRIPDKPMINEREVQVTTEELLLPYDEDGMKHSLQTTDEKKEVLHSLFWETTGNENEFSWTIHQKIKNFFDGIIYQRPAEVLGQKCGMDRPDNIAIDMKGNVTTCQNTSSLTKHNIGTIEKLDEVRLDTSHHWSTRAECPSCPVVQLCQGACLFLEDEYWSQACENLFYYNMAMLASSLFFLTGGLVLTKIEGDKIRFDGTTSMDVIDINFVKSNGKQKSWKVRKPIGIPVVSVPKAEEYAVQ